MIILHFPHELDNTPDSRDTEVSKFYNTAVQPSPDAKKYQASFDATHEEAIREVSDFVKPHRGARCWSVGGVPVGCLAYQCHPGSFEPVPSIRWSQPGCRVPTV